MRPTQNPAGMTALDGEKAEWLLLALPGLIWGASFLFMAEGLHALGPFGVTFVRICIGFLTLSLFPSARKPILRADWPGIIGLGVLWLAFPLTMFPLAERHVTSALTGMLNGANPLFTAVVASVIARRLPSSRVMTGIGIGITGAVLMAIPGTGQGQNSVAGVALIVAALVSYGLALNVAAPLQQRNGALPVIWRAQMIALLLTAPRGIPDALAARWTFWPVLALLALGSLGTGIAYVVMSLAAGRFGATRASATTFLIPGVALGLGILVRHEQVTPLSVLGSCVCVAGAWLIRPVRRSPGVRTTSPPLKQTSPLDEIKLCACEQKE
jgi:drug/metabolite transporter (DMT)-like permease